MGKIVYFILFCFEVVPRDVEIMNFLIIMRIFVAFMVIIRKLILICQFFKVVMVISFIILFKHLFLSTLISIIIHPRLFNL